MATTQLLARWVPANQADDRTLADLAASFADADVESIRVVRACRMCGSDEHGKPEILRSDGEPPIHVSLARCAGRAVVAVTDAGPIGVDVEEANVREISTWVRVESLVKATGHGLQLDPESILVTAPELPPRLLTWPGHEPLGTPVWMFDLAAPQGFIACASVLCAEPPRLVPPTAAPGE